MSVNADFHSDFMINYGNLLPPMLADDIRIMIYIGMQARLSTPISTPGCWSGDQQCYALSCTKTDNDAFEAVSACQTPSDNSVGILVLRRHEPSRGHAPGEVSVPWRETVQCSTRHIRGLL